MIFQNNIFIDTWSKTLISSKTSNQTIIGQKIFLVIIWFPGGRRDCVLVLTKYSSALPNRLLVDIILQWWCLWQKNALSVNFWYIRFYNLSYWSLLYEVLNPRSHTPWNNYYNREVWIRLTQERFGIEEEFHIEPAKYSY